MKLSIVILHHNTHERVEACLQSLKTAIIPNETEVIVIDNGEKNGNKNIATKLIQNKAIKFYSIKNHGFPAGQNFGTAVSTGEFIAVVNPDIIFTQDCLQKLVTHIEAHTNAGLVTSALQLPSGIMQDNIRPFPTMWNIMQRRLQLKKNIIQMQDHAEWKQVDWCTGALWVIRRTALEAINGHDERYFLFMSDISLCRELWNANFEVHQVTSAVAIHGEERLSDGHALQMIFKKTGRIHIMDALRYFWQYAGQGIPPLCPSVKK